MLGEDKRRIVVYLALPRDTADASEFEAMFDATDAGEDAADAEHKAQKVSLPGDTVKRHERYAPLHPHAPRPSEPSPP